MAVNNRPKSRGPDPFSLCFPLPALTQIQLSVLPVLSTTSGPAHARQPDVPGFSAGDGAASPVHGIAACAAAPVFKRQQEKLLQAQGLAAAQLGEVRATAAPAVPCPSTSPASPPARCVDGGQTSSSAQGTGGQRAGQDQWHGED